MVFIPLCLILLLVGCSGTSGGSIACPEGQHSFVPTGQESYSGDKDCNGYDRTMQCTACGSLYTDFVPPTGHAYVKDASLSTPPTCSELGLDHYTCSRCGEIKEEPIDLLGHSYDVSNYEPPTCDDGGEVLATCTRCGYICEDYISPTEEHIWEPQPAKDPTCTEEGHREYSLCLCCGANDLWENRIEPLSHVISDEWTVDIEPTATSYGQRSRHCTRPGCSHTEDATSIPKKGYSDFLTYTLTQSSATVTGIMPGYEGSISILSIPDEYNGVPVKYIAQNAFANNENIYVLRLPETIQTVDRYAFRGCTNLSTVEIADESALIQIAVEAFADCTSLASINLPDGLWQIEEYAFRNCALSGSLVIPDTVSMICLGAFQECDKITSLTLPKLYDSATDIYGSTYYLGFIFGATSSNYSASYIPAGLESLTFTKIDLLYSDALSGCSGLKHLYLSELTDSSFQLSAELFSTCPNLIYTSYDGVNYIGNAENPYLYLIGPADRTKTTYTLMDAKYIVKDAFKNCTALTAITIPDSVVTIWDSAFQGCTDLASVTWGDDISYLGSSAFDGCESLQAITLPAALVRINSYTFRNCYSLSSVRIHENVRIIYSGAFHNAGQGRTAYTFRISFDTTEGWRSITPYGSSTVITYVADSARVTAELTNDEASYTYSR